MSDPEENRDPVKSTEEKGYAQRLVALQEKPWKKLLRFCDPYGWHIRRVIRAPALEVGCGIGRVLSFAPGEITGVDHNAHAVEICRQRGLDAWDTTEFPAVSEGTRYNSIVFSHVLEHMTLDEARAVLADYLPCLADGGRLVLICPQERGYDSDETHVEFMDAERLEGLCRDAGLVVRKSYSFPFPRALGRAYIYNEFVVIAEKPAQGPSK